MNTWRRTASNEATHTPSASAPLFPVGPHLMGVVIDDQIGKDDHIRVSVSVVKKAVAEAAQYRLHPMNQLRG